jgi:hypothetical protein
MTQKHRQGDTSRTLQKKEREREEISRRKIKEDECGGIEREERKD